MDEQATLISETAWNLYRAFRTYPNVQQAMANARAVLPEKEHIRSVHFIDENGVADESITYEMPEQSTMYWIALIAHARAIVLASNLENPTTDESFNKWGINAVTECLAYEIEHEAGATRGQCEEWCTLKMINYSDDYLTPVVGKLHDRSNETYVTSLYPQIILNPSIYESKENFIKHVNTMLPEMYDRLYKARLLLTNDYIDAMERAQEEGLRQKRMTPERVSEIVHEHGKAALFGHLKEEQWQEWEAEKYVYDGGSNIPKYDKPAPKCNPASGLKEEEWQFYWHFCTLEPNGTCRVCIPQLVLGLGAVAAPTRLLRGRFLSGDRRRTFADFHRHTQWWVASRIEGKSYRGIAKTAGIASHTVVRSAILRLKEDFMLSDEGGAS